MKISLVQCPCWAIFTPPYRIAVLTAYLRNRGHQVYVKDLNIELYHEKKSKYADGWVDTNHLFWMEPDSVSNFIFDHSELITKKVDEILNTDAEVIGFSIQEDSEYVAREVAKRIKEKDRKKIIVFGGPQASRVNNGYQLAKLDYVDFVVQGESEITLEEIIRRLERKENINFCVGTILKQNEKVVDCGDRPLISDLNSLPFADFSDFDFSKYSNPFRLPISFSRGCPSRCIYCNERPYWKRFRFRKAESVVSEIKYQIERISGIKHLDFHDSLINGAPKELERFCDLIIAEGLKIRWNSFAAVSKYMTYDLLLKMKRAGCVNLIYGLETGSYRVMMKIGKVLARGANIDQVIRDTHKVGIEGSLNFMFGFPGETEEEFQETLDFLSRNKKYIYEVNPTPGFCNFHKGSYAYEHPDEFDIILGEGGSYWESKDGTNTYPVRLERFERFLKKANELGIKSAYPGTQLKDRDRMLGYYYFQKKEWGKAISHLKEAVKQQSKNEERRLFLAKSLAFAKSDKEAKEAFEEVIKIKLSKKDSLEAQSVAEEAKTMGIILDPDPSEKENTLSPTKSTSDHNKNGLICIHPFTFLNFSPNGDVSTCPCPHHLKYRLGNIKYNTIAEIWNSDTARQIRRKIYAGEWQDICKPICPFIIDYRRSNKVIKYEELEKNEFLSPALIEEIRTGKDYLKSPPTHFQPDISTNASTLCNLHCIMCDVHQTKNDPALGKKLWADLKHYLPTAKYIELAGWGEPLVRPETRELLINYHGPAEFRLTTNGLLLPKYWEKIKHQKFPWLKISIDAATKETYEKIRLGAKWEDLITALNLVKQNRDKFPFVMINMTVMRNNYKEIPQFINLAESYGFDCLFHAIHSGKNEPDILWGDENIFELNNTKALAELRNIVINENSKKRNIEIYWLNLPYYLKIKELK